MTNDRPWHPGRDLPPKADVYERRQRDGRVYFAFFDSVQWFIGAQTIAEALEQHINSPLQTGAEWRETK